MEQKVKYDYSLLKIDFPDRIPLSKQYIRVICNIHGEFKILLYKHKNGAKCQKCYGRNKTTEEHIFDFNKIHNNKYGYSKFKYVKANIKSIIICPLHGDFFQTPNSHRSGKGCLKCGGKIKSNIFKFVEKANKIHHNKYDYSKFKYIDTDTKSTIICHIHGEFKQRPYKHLNGSNCPKCIGHKKNKNDHINDFTKKHGTKYNYSLTKYIDSHSKVIIICPLHGKFSQTPTSHKNGHGCPSCSKLIPKNVKWNKLDCVESAKRYKTKKDWKLKHKNLYLAAYRNKWLDECCKHMKK